MEWVFAHMEDADFNDPPAVDTGAAAESTPSVVGADGCADPESVAMLQSMFRGDARRRSRRAAETSSAADWLFSRADDLDAAVAEAESAAVRTAEAEARTVLLPLGRASTDRASTNSTAVSHMGANNWRRYCGRRQDGRAMVHLQRPKGAVSAKLPLDGYLPLPAQGTGATRDTRGGETRGGGKENLSTNNATPQRRNGSSCVISLGARDGTRALGLAAAARTRTLTCRPARRAFARPPLRPHPTAPDVARRRRRALPEPRVSPSPTLAQGRAHPRQPPHVPRRGQFDTPPFSNQIS